MARPKNKEEARPPRVVVENVQPCIDHGRFPVKRIIREKLLVSADVFADGHDLVRAMLLYRRKQADGWTELAMEKKGNDRFVARFAVEEPGVYEYTVEGWIDMFGSWLQEVKKKFEAGQDIALELMEGVEHIKDAAGRAADGDARWLTEQARLISDTSLEQEVRYHAAVNPVVASFLWKYPDRRGSQRFPINLLVQAERERALYGSWYELFPRSCTNHPEQHGTFQECAKRLAYVASMHFNVVYLPPIHPIGKSYRKGPNNSLKTKPGDPGSPWAIGSAEGGHKSVHPQLGTLEDFDALVKQAEKYHIEIALDLAYQCSPDHPYVREHPDWFKHRMDGSIKYAENPPKKYQDIYPLDFECADWKNLWNELKSVVLFWIDHGVRIFRVDNPHTKPFRFWEWLIGEVRAEHPDVIFLAEAFTRPKVMKYLAKCGFSQSYTYFTWRNTRMELIDYFTELTRPAVCEYMRPNLFANTPDILHDYLQFGGRPAFQIRLVLAATLAASFGIYGPAFELCENRAVPGTEEYLDSEKYQVRMWNLDSRRNIKPYIAKINQIRSENAALQINAPLQFLHTDNDQLICYAKYVSDLSNILVIVVNLDPHHTQSGWIQLPLDDLNLTPTQVFQAHDLLNDARYLWQGERNFVLLDPQVAPAHIFRLRRKIKTEHDFDYYQ